MGRTGHTPHAWSRVSAACSRCGPQASTGTQRWDPAIPGLSSCLQGGDWVALRDAVPTSSLMVVPPPREEQFCGGHGIPSTEPFPNRGLAGYDVSSGLGLPRLLHTAPPPTQVWGAWDFAPPGLVLGATRPLLWACLCHLQATRGLLSEATCCSEGKERWREGKGGRRPLVIKFDSRPLLIPAAVFSSRVLPLTPPESGVRSPGESAADPSGWPGRGRERGGAQLGSRAGGRAATPQMPGSV